MSKISPIAILLINVIFIILVGISAVLSTSIFSEFWQQFLIFLLILSAFLIACNRIFFSCLWRDILLDPNGDNMVKSFYILWQDYFMGNVMRLALFLPSFFKTKFDAICGAKIGKNSIIIGNLHDPIFITVGKCSIVGFESVVYAHVIEGDRPIQLMPIEIGDNVMIGARAIIMPGTKVEDGAKVAAGSVVTKGTLIPSGEIWGGVPAKCLKKANLHN